jgi:ribonuclease G
MKGILIALGHIEGREVAALMVDGLLEDLFYETDDLTPGAILRGVVGRPVKGLGGVFVDLPGGARGFVRAPKGLAPGQRIVAQVAGVAEPGKAVPLSLRLIFKSRYAIVTPDAPGVNVSRQITDEALRDELQQIAAQVALPEGAGAILRSAAAETDPEAVHRDLAEQAALAAAVLGDLSGGPELLVDAPGPHDRAWRDWPAPDVLDDTPDALDNSGARDQIAALLRATVDLGEGHMSVEPTRALVAVDVNTGSDTSPAAGLKACINAARDLPRQLRLRGLGGQVVVDFAPCPKKDRHVVEQVLKKAFRAESAETVLAGWTPLGNFEISRKRDRAPLPAWLA